MEKSNGEDKVPAKAAGKGSRLEPNWQPTEDQRIFCAEFGLDVQRIVDDFRDYWIQQEGAKARKVDWAAAWRVWCRREGDRHGRGKRDLFNSSANGEGDGELRKAGETAWTESDGLRDRHGNVNRKAMFAALRPRYTAMVAGWWRAWSEEVDDWLERSFEPNDRNYARMLVADDIKERAWSAAQREILGLGNASIMWLVDDWERISRRVDSQLHSRAGYMGGIPKRRGNGALGVLLELKPAPELIEEIPAADVVEAIAPAIIAENAQGPAEADPWANPNG